MKKRTKNILLICCVLIIAVGGVGYQFKKQILSLGREKNDYKMRTVGNVHHDPIPYTGAGGNAEMIDYLNIVYQKINCPQCKFMNTAIANDLLNKAVPTDPKERFIYNFMLCNQLMNSGRVDEAIKLIEEYEKTADYKKLEDKDLYKWCLATGITYLRFGELKNCIADHNAQSCIWPLSEMARHKDEWGARKAIEIYTRILDNYAQDLNSRWLLNIAYMQIGEYPEKVPTAYLIPPESFKTEFETPRFNNIAGDIGVDYADMCGSIIMEDFNNDGFTDIFQGGWGLNEQVHYLINKGDGTFEDLSEKAGLNKYPGGLMMMQTDYNNDGFLDVFILRGAWFGEFGILPNALLKNNGDNTFTDVTVETGLFSCHPTQTATWADFNNDGWLDVFIGNEANRNGGDKINDCELFLNNKGHFTNITKETGINLNAFVKGVSSGDYDNDGDADIYISVNGAENHLYKNETKKGSKTLRFADVSIKAGIKGPLQSFSCMFFDYNNDGWLDILNFSYDPNAADNDIAAEYLKLPRKSELTALYINNKNGTFSDKAKENGLDRTFLVMGCSYGDFDMDGWIDFYAGTGKPSFRSLIPNRLFHNNEGKGFQDCTTSSGMGHLQKGHGISFADLNHDGYPEIFAQMGGAYEGDGFQDCLYENPATWNNNFIAIDLVGTTSNKIAIGARLKIISVQNGIKRDIYEWITTGASFGANNLRAEIGLGKANDIESIEIYWPQTGITQVIKNVAINQHIKIVEGNNDFSILTLPPFKFKVPDDEIPHQHKMVM